MDQSGHAATDKLSIDYYCGLWNSLLIYTLVCVMQKMQGE